MSQADAYADLEVRVLARGEGGYPVELTLEGEQELLGGLLPEALPAGSPGETVSFDPAAFTRWFFNDPRLRGHWEQVRGQHPRRRIRLRIDPDAPELHQLPWEMLRGDEQGEALSVGASTPFSRYLAGEWRPGSPVLRRPLRVLAAIANPDGLDEYGLQPVEVETERALLGQALEGRDMEVEWLTGAFSLADLRERLVGGRFHVLHLVAHGAVAARAGTSVLYLADPRGSGTAGVPAAEVARLLGTLLADNDTRQEDKLRLVFLAACQSATRSPADAFRGLAPELVQAGVPAVLAMQDLVPVESARELARVFYGRLLRHGLVDLSCNEARAALGVAGLSGQSVPVLFMRLRSGALLGRRGQLSLGEGAATDRFWDELLQKIAFSQCVPVLGPGVHEGLLDSASAVAEVLAEKADYPLADRSDLARVAQFLSYDQGDPVQLAYLNQLKLSLLRRLGVRLSGRKRLLLGKKSFNELLVEHDWVEQALARQETTIYHMLADLDLPLYLTTSPDGFMEEALRWRLARRLGDPASDPFADAEPAQDGFAPLGKMYPGQPDQGSDNRALRARVRVRQEGLRWDMAGEGAPQYRLDPSPTINDPVVFHLCGHDGDEQQRRNLVLSEDDHLSHLVRLRTRRDLVLPANVTESISTCSLLFLGYRIDDWSFRVLLQGLLASIDSAKDDRWNIGVQLELEQAPDTERALAYLRRYLEAFKITIYWGTVQQFVSDLHARWQEEMSE